MKETSANSKIRTLTILAIVIAGGSLYGGMASAGTSAPTPDPNCSHQVGYRLTNNCKDENVQVLHGDIGTADSMSFVVTGSHSSAYASLFCRRPDGSAYARFNGLAPQDTYKQSLPCLPGDYPSESYCGSDSVCAQKMP